jgi:hypothetical protein
MGDGEDPDKKGEADGLPGIIATAIVPEWPAPAPARYRRSIRTVAKIMATTFYGEAALGREFRLRAVAGIALYPVLCGTIGALFGLTLAIRDAAFPTPPIGALEGPGWYYPSFAIRWQNINPLIPLYTHTGPAVAGWVRHSQFHAKNYP